MHLTKQIMSYSGVLSAAAAALGGAQVGINGVQWESEDWQFGCPGCSPRSAPEQAVSFEVSVLVHQNTFVERAVSY